MNCWDSPFVLNWKCVPIVIIVNIFLFFHIRPHFQNKVVFCFSSIVIWLYFLLCPYYRVTCIFEELFSADVFFYYTIISPYVCQLERFYYCVGNKYFISEVTYESIHILEDKKVSLFKFPGLGISTWWKKCWRKRNELSNKFVFHFVVSVIW